MIIIRNKTRASILKSFGIDIDLQKGKRTGYYTDTSANRKAGIVGQKYTRDMHSHPGDDKDTMRMHGIDKRAGGDHIKATRLGQNMANAIKDSDKAGRRASAAASHYGEGHPITTAFKEKHEDLMGVKMGDDTSLPYGKGGAGVKVEVKADDAGAKRAKAAKEGMKTNEKEYNKEKKLDNMFVGSLSKKILNSGGDITYLPHNGNAITRDGKEAMQRNGRKWTIGYKTDVTGKDGKKLNLHFDAVTDEGGGRTLYILDRASSKEFFEGWNVWNDAQGKRVFEKHVMSKLA